MQTLKKIAFTIGCLVIVLWVLDKVYEFGLRQNKNAKADYVQKNKINAQVLFHGPCEPLWMMDPKQIDEQTQMPSYNLALSHSDFADNFLHLYLYLKNNSTPKYLFLYVTPESLDKKFNTFNTYRFAEFLNDTLVEDVVKENDPDYYWWSKIPFMRFAYYNSNVTFNMIQGYKHYFGNRTEAFYPSGFEPPAKIVWDNHLEDMQKQYPLGYRFEIDSLRLKYLYKIIEMAQRNKISVILYESPVLNESKECTINREETIKLIQQIAAKYKITYKQFDNLPLSNSRDYFISSLNLNEKGLRIFNDTIARYIKQLH